MSEPEDAITWKVRRLAENEAARQEASLGAGASRNPGRCAAHGTVPSEDSVPAGSGRPSSVGIREQAQPEDSRQSYPKGVPWYVRAVVGVLMPIERFVDKHGRDDG